MQYKKPVMLINGTGNRANMLILPGVEQQLRKAGRG